MNEKKLSKTPDIVESARESRVATCEDGRCYWKWVKDPLRGYYNWVPAGKTCCPDPPDLNWNNSYCLEPDFSPPDDSSDEQRYESQCYHMGDVSSDDSESTEDLVLIRMPIIQELESGGYVTTGRWNQQAFRLDGRTSGPCYGWDITASRIQQPGIRQQFILPQLQPKNDEGFGDICASILVGFPFRRGVDPYPRKLYWLQTSNMHVNQDMRPYALIMAGELALTVSRPILSEA